MSPTLPPESQRIPVGARPQAGVNLFELTLYVDERPLETLRLPPYQTFWRLEPGAHTFVARGRTVDGQLVQSETVQVFVRESD
jgi:hypothetical protein